MCIGLRIWVLTGDKKTTAIQIATSCNLIVPEQHGRRILIEADANTPLDRLKMQLDDFYTLAMCDLHALPATTGIDAHNPRDSPITPGTPAAHANSHHGDGGRRQVSVIIDGVALRRIMEDPDVTASFVNLGLISQAVICCRVTPHQKQAVVEMVAARGYNTLSVGDGGNDVAMIQKANIGVGKHGACFTVCLCRISR